MKNKVEKFCARYLRVMSICVTSCMYIMIVLNYMITFFNA